MFLEGSKHQGQETYRILAHCVSLLRASRWAGFPQTVFKTKAMLRLGIIVSASPKTLAGFIQPTVHLRSVSKPFTV